jgi:hypothetical protein
MAGYLNSKFLAILQERFEKHHELRTARVNDDSLEEFIAYSLYKSRDNSELVHWPEGGRQSGWDVSRSNSDSTFDRISIKSLMASGNQIIMTSYRTTKLNSIREKVDYFCQNHYDYFIGSIYRKKVLSVDGVTQIHHTYEIVTIPKIPYESLKTSPWIVKSPTGDYVTAYSDINSLRADWRSAICQVGDLTFRITKSASHQLSITFSSRRMITTLTKFVICQNYPGYLI